MGGVGEVAGKVAVVAGKAAEVAGKVAEVARFCERGDLIGGLCLAGDFGAEVTGSGDEEGGLHFWE